MLCEKHLRWWKLSQGHRSGRTDTTMRGG